jgi:hypothetical protein
VIERRRADDQVERVVGVADVFGHPECECQPVISSDRAGRLYHLGSGVNADKLLGIAIVTCQCLQQIAGPASHIKHPVRGGDGGHSETASAIGDLVMQPTPPAAVVPCGPIVERGDVPVRRHALSVPPYGTFGEALEVEQSPASHDEIANG